MSTRPIAPHPRAQLALLARAPSPAMERALARTALLYRYSRDALHAFFMALGARRGTPVWMPSFHCGIEVRTAADAGFAPRFYRVGDDLAVDEDDLARGLRAAPGPVLVIHYFGFAQPGIERIAALCAAASVPLLEDCAHAPLSTLGGRELGTFGPAATFSFSKTFGTVDGGGSSVDATALARIVGHDLALARPRGRPPIAWHAQRDDLRRRRRDEPPRDRDPARAHAALAARFAHRVVSAERNIFAGELRYGRGISLLSLALLRRCDPALAVLRRRANYQHLDALLRGAPGYRPLYGALSEGTCPLYLPAFVRNRTEVLLRLQAAHAAPFIFGMFHHPAMHAARFPETARLREELLCLPIHQDLDARDIERIATVLRPLLADDRPGSANVAFWRVRPDARWLNARKAW
jgi:dTDP-4-amino-4,6-dideoxygalactose transaminase